MVFSQIIDASRDTLSGSRAVDEDGNLLVLHHGTAASFETFSKTTDIGFHFGDRNQALKRRSHAIKEGHAKARKHWEIRSVVLGIKNPILMNDDPVGWNPCYLTQVFQRYMDQTARNEIRLIASGEYEARGTPEGSVLRKIWCNVIKERLLECGFDGVVYRNMIEANASDVSWAWLAFDDTSIVKLGTDLKDPPAALTFSESGLPMIDRLKEIPGLRRRNGYFRLRRDRDAFQVAIHEWLVARGCEPRWSEMYGQAKVGDERGFAIDISQERGDVILVPFAPDRNSYDLMADFESDHSERFFEKGLHPLGKCKERLTWHSCETLEEFISRADAMANEFHRDFAQDRCMVPA